jgi:hypothetical protein
MYKLYTESPLFYKATLSVIKKSGLERRWAPLLRDNLVVFYFPFCKEKVALNERWALFWETI